MLLHLSFIIGTLLIKRVNPQRKTEAFVTLFQVVSVTVSVLTLTFISIDRYYAICYPLKFKSTTSRAKKAIVLIWVLALLFDLPELVVLETQPKELALPVIYFTQCVPSWSTFSDTMFHCIKTLLLFFLPLSFMSVAYYQIVKVLWSKNNIPGHAESKSCHEYSGTACNGSTNGVNSASARRQMNRSISSSSQVIGRRKAAKMLVMVDIMFAICYCPVHTYSILRYATDIPQTEFTTAFAMIAHWMCYFNSAINPLIYNFMSGESSSVVTYCVHGRDGCYCSGVAGNIFVREGAASMQISEAPGEKMLPCASASRLGQGHRAPLSHSASLHFSPSYLHAYTKT
ncbi:hypothetical protein ONE63_004043 [Megalurothrips usitatus]|uniref:G-protein coupled receptors family 1 profile domain-containing protein n=1 Tax=Megalurothrips usitatus TaxID=439358 RepID=A0AAV7X8K1_9NEOP|nr:hypothetical protein ONE63_004043 [Megalurothrips usitatus]